MAKSIVFLFLFLSYQNIFGKNIVSYEVKENQTQVFMFGLFAHSECLIADWGVLECAYKIGKGEFKEEDFEFKAICNKVCRKDENIIDVFIQNNNIVVQFELGDKFFADLNLSSQDFSHAIVLNEAIEKVNKNYSLSPYRLMIIYSGVSFDKNLMGEPVKQKNF